MLSTPLHSDLHMIPGKHFPVLHFFSTPRQHAHEHEHDSVLNESLFATSKELLTLLSYSSRFDTSLKSIAEFDETSFAEEKTLDRLRLKRS